ncbi:BACON domain-containing protein [Candidatus Magnetobacterium casense]|uniref:BACON domain-containing protein n=1 Tax=Candidatus Magnetobacterium casense TaxID=1455061 RepID=UPI0012DE3BE4
MTPNTGYSIGSVTGCGGSLSGNTYTTGAITANCTVTATFSLSPTPPPCSYSITPTIKSFPATGGSDTISVIAGSSCAWTATSNATSWLTVNTPSVSGNGTVSYTVAANTATTSRTGTITIAGQTLTVTQLGIDCNSMTITPTSKDLSTNNLYKWCLNML